MPLADSRTRDERYDDTRECNAPRAGRKAVCIFHAGAGPAVIENIYMLFMGHTCFKNQTRHRAIPRRFSPCALSSSTFRTQTPSFPPLFLRLLPFFCFTVPYGTAYSVAAPSLNSFIRFRGTTSRTCRQRLENSTKRFTPLLLSASFPPTKQRILVWIEFLMEPTPPGSRSTLFNHPVRRRFPSRYSAIRASSANCIETSATTSSYIDFSGHAISSRTKVDDEKGAHLRKVKKAVTCVREIGR